mgnify:CR=1 FL=1
MPFASIVIQNVRRPKDVDAIYKRAYNLLKTSLENQKTQAESVQLLNKIKNKWIVNELNQTSTNSGTSKLIQKGFNFIEDSAENKQNNTKEKAIHLFIILPPFLCSTKFEQYNYTQILSICQFKKTLRDRIYLHTIT